MVSVTLQPPAAASSSSTSTSTSRWATINSSSSRSATGIRCCDSSTAISSSGIHTSLQAAYAGSCGHGSSTTPQTDRQPEVIVDDISTSLTDQTRSPSGPKAAAGSRHSESDGEPAQPQGGIACHLGRDTRLHQVLQAAGATAASVAQLSTLAGNVAKHVHRLKLQASAAQQAATDHGRSSAGSLQCPYDSCSCKDCQSDTIFNTALLELPDSHCAESSGSSGCAGGSSNGGSSSSSSSHTASVQGGRPLQQCRDTVPLVAFHGQGVTASSAAMPPKGTALFHTDWSACGSATTPAECLRSFLAADLWEHVRQQLQEVGTVLCNALPVPWLCNNPGCANMAGASEQQLVGGRSCVCGGCSVAR